MVLFSVKGRPGGGLRPPHPRSQSAASAASDPPDPPANPPPDSQPDPPQKMFPI